MAVLYDRPPSAGQLLSGGGGVADVLGGLVGSICAKKEEQEGKTAAMVGVFVLLKREKRAFSVACSSLLCLSLQ